MIMKRHNQEDIPAAKTEMRKTKLTTGHLHSENTPQAERAATSNRQSPSTRT